MQESLKTFSNNFIGRNDILADFISRFQNTKFAFIYGLTGVGKTEFYFRAKENLIKSFEKHIYLACTFDMSVSDLLSNLLTAKLQNKQMAQNTSIEGKLIQIASILSSTSCLLCIDDFQNLMTENQKLFLGYLKNQIEQTSSKSKIILISNKLPAFKNDLEFLETLWLELKGLPEEHFVELINYYLTLYSSSLSHEHKIEFYKITGGNPQITKMILLYLLGKKYPLEDIISRSLLSTKELKNIFYEYYFKEYSKEHLETLKFLSCIRTPVDKAVFCKTTSAAPEYLTKLESDLILDYLEWNKIKLNPLLSGYLQNNLSDNEKVNLNNKCIKYYENLKDDLIFTKQKEIFHHLINVGDVKKAQEVVAAIHRKLINSGDFDYADFMIREIEKHAELPLSLILAKAEILSHRAKREESIRLLENALTNKEWNNDIELKIMLGRQLVRGTSKISEAESQLKDALELLEKPTTKLSHNGLYKSLDEAKISAMSELGRTYFTKQEFNLALSTLNDANTLLGQNPDASDNIKASLVYNFGSAYLELADYKNAKKYFELAKEIFIKNNKMAEIAGTCLNLASTCFLLDDQETACSLLGKAEEIAKNFGYNFLLAGVFHVKGVYHFRYGYFQNALDMFFATNKLIGHLKDNIWTARNKLWIIETNMILGNTQMAFSLWEQIPPTAKQNLGLEATRIELLLFLSSGKYSEALQTIDSIKKDEKKYYDTIEKTKFRLALIKYHLQMLDFATAKNICEEILAVPDSLPNYYKNQALSLTALIYLHLQETKKALDILLKTTEYHENFNYFWDLIKDDLNLSDVVLTQNDNDKSLKLLFQALAKAQELNLKNEISLIQAKIAITYLNIKKFEPIPSYIYDSLALAVKGNDQKLKALNYTVIKNYLQCPIKNKEEFLKRISIEKTIQSAGEIDIILKELFGKLTKYEQNWIRLQVQSISPETYEKYQIISPTKTEVVSKKDYNLITSSDNLPVEIIIDCVQKVVYEKQKKKVDFLNKATLFNLIQTLANSPNHNFTKEDLAQKVWDEEYNPLRHDNLIYTSVNRLRSIIEPGLATKKFKYILNTGNKYFFNGEISFYLIKKYNEHADKLNNRQQWAIDYLCSNPTITTKIYCEKFKINRTTAFLELNNMASNNILVRSGKARSTYYSLKR